eukprot:30047-Pelagococcus_subviridis.AAC.1
MTKLKRNARRTRESRQISSPARRRRRGWRFGGSARPSFHAASRDDGGAAQRRPRVHGLRVRRLVARRSRSNRPNRDECQLRSRDAPRPSLPFPP